MRAGTVAVIGKANAGKSTLINVMVGEKVAIVSPKPQTTRDRILGVLTREDRQIVFVDTPGLYKVNNALTELMMKTTDVSARNVDLILYVIDIHEGVRDDDIENVKKYERLGIPMFVVCSKIDIMPKEEVAPNLLKLSEAGVESDIFPVSARKGRGIRQLEDDIVSVLPEGNKVFEEDIISDKSERFMIAEIMREKILLKYDKEIPHGVAIVVHTFEKRPTGNLYDIGLDIVCDKQNHKAILIGKQGQALKEVSAFARQDMEKFLGAKVFLTTYVKVEEGWREKQKLIREFGYEEPN